MAVMKEVMAYYIDVGSRIYPALDKDGYDQGRHEDQEEAPKIPAGRAARLGLRVRRLLAIVICV